MTAPRIFWGSRGWGMAFDAAKESKRQARAVKPGALFLVTEQGGFAGYRVGDVEPFFLGREIDMQMAKHIHADDHVRHGKRAGLEQPAARQRHARRPQQKRGAGPVMHRDLVGQEIDLQIRDLDAFEGEPVEEMAVKRDAPVATGFGCLLYTSDA